MTDYARADDLPSMPDYPEDLPSWLPVDLSTYLDGTHKPSVPTLLARTDGVCLLYPGLIHSLHGESESGKSLVAQYLAAQQIMAGSGVLFIDFESDAATVTERLLMLGATPQAIREHFHYIRPEVDPRAAAELPAWHAMLARSYVLAVIDGVTDSLGVFGYSTKDNDEVAAWMRVLPKNIANKTGAAVAVIDHVTKDADSRGRFAIGAQAKMSGLTGAGLHRGGCRGPWAWSARRHRPASGQGPPRPRARSVRADAQDRPHPGSRPRRHRLHHRPRPPARHRGALARPRRPGRYVSGRSDPPGSWNTCQRPSKAQANR